MNNFTQKDAVRLNEYVSIRFTSGMPYPITKVCLFFVAIAANLFHHP